MNRRNFLNQLTAMSVVSSLDRFTCFAEESPSSSLTSFRVTQRTAPVAIAMWDFSWVLRHDPGHEIGSEFSNWDLVLDELWARGYNAIRFDIFPHLVARQSDGKILESVDWGG